MMKTYEEIPSQKLFVSWVCLSYLVGQGTVIFLVMLRALFLHAAELAEHYEGNGRCYTWKGM